MGDNASANGFEGQLATSIHWWSSVASRCWPALALRLQQLVRDQPGQDQPGWRCNIDVDVGRVRQLLLRIAADIEELEGTTSAAGRSSASRGERMLIRALGRGKPALSQSGNCAPTSLTLRGAQMDLGPPALNCRTSRDNRECRTVHKAPIHKPPRIHKREASRKVGCTWPPRRPRRLLVPAACAGWAAARTA
jgi:hypothetical protein